MNFCVYYNDIFVLNDKKSSEDSVVCMSVRENELSCDRGGERGLREEIGRMRDRPDGIFPIISSRDNASPRCAEHIIIYCSYYIVYYNL